MEVMIIGEKSGVKLHIMFPPVGLTFSVFYRFHEVLKSEAEEAVSMPTSSRYSR